jgi:hypothetical protein
VLFPDKADGNDAACGDGDGHAEESLQHYMDRLPQSGGS